MQIQYKYLYLSKHITVYDKIIPRHKFKSIGVSRQLKSEVNGVGGWELGVPKRLGGQNT